MIARFFVLLLRVYQRTLSPLIGPVCRFSPSCSNYMVICIERFGAARGLWLGTRRLARCHPFHPGGIDLPPEVTPPEHSRSEDAERDPSRSLPPRSFKQTP